MSKGPSFPKGIRYEIPEKLPVLPVRNIVLFPMVSMPMMIGREKSIKLIDDVLVSNRFVAIVAQKDPDIEDPKESDLYRAGCVAIVLKMMKFPDGQMRTLIQGIARINIDEFLTSEPYFTARVSQIKESFEYSEDSQAKISALKKSFQILAERSPIISKDLVGTVMSSDDPSFLTDIIAINLNLKLPELQELLGEGNINKRLERVLDNLNREIEVLELGNKIQDNVRQQIDRSQREYYLREQLKAIKKELGDDDGEREIQEFREKIEKLGLPDEVRKEAERELSRMEKMHPESAEYTVSRTYLDWICELPWNISTEDNLDIENVKKTLDEDHFGLEKVKDRIIEYLAVRKLKSDMKGPILCFVGPPGVGKTSLGRSIARAMGRKFERLSLGGIRDEAEIRGHRRTYVGALPGRIIRALRKVGSNNPVIMLDEVDKLGMDFRGDPASALLEVLDPEQNFSFTDHYLDVPFDLSKVLFITTANLMDPIPPPLLDRMEIIEIPGYIVEEKLMIAKNHLIPKQIRENGLSGDLISFKDEAIIKIISSYTREAGVRNLERVIASVCRKVARNVAIGNKERVIVDEKKLVEFLGPEKHFSEIVERTNIAGVAIGLAWTPVGGEILFIEATRMKGSKGFSLTGKLGEVMSESAQAALAYIRSNAARFGIEEDFFEKGDIHVHIPAGSIPKDGPSAGITIATAIVSLLTGKLVRSDTAMTGEITLRGKVLPVGGIKEKILAAARMGITRIILPKNNEADLSDIPENIRSKLTFIPVATMEEVLENAISDFKLTDELSSKEERNSRKKKSK
ncbi:MAG: endopeptidase La [Deltaproteobacteria bacterium]|nr:endopeptidase La [Deltaproteobacteria bacterium]